MSQSSTLGDRYVLAADRSGHDRLRLLAQIHDPHTRTLLTSAGVSRAKQYGEFGCGLGTIARWVATQGPAVTALDLSKERLVQARELAGADGLRKIRWLEASVYEHGLPHGSLDFACCRWLLVHLSRPLDALHGIAQALRPGGTLVCEEPDVSAIYSEPDSAAYRRYWGLVSATGEKRGVDYAGGRRLHAWLRAAGFEIERADAYQIHRLAGEEKAFWSWTFREASPAMIADGIITAAEAREMDEGLQRADADPSVLVGHARVHQVVARKP